MNASQRRTAVRKINELIGLKAEYVTRDGRTCPVTIVGRTVPVLHLASTWPGYNYNGTAPSQHRVRVHRDLNTSNDGTFSPRLNQLRIAA